MEWTSRYQDKWPRLTALFRLGDQEPNGIEDPVQGYGPPHPDGAGYYRYYVHPDDIRANRDMNAYSMSQTSNESNRSRKPPFCGLCLGTMLIFSFAAVISVSVILSILWTEPQDVRLSLSNDTEARSPTENDPSKNKNREKEISSNICRLMKSALERSKITSTDKRLKHCNISLTSENDFIHVNLFLEVGNNFLKGDIKFENGIPKIHLENSTLQEDITPIVESSTRSLLLTTIQSKATEETTPENVLHLTPGDLQNLENIMRISNSTPFTSSESQQFNKTLLSGLSKLPLDIPLNTIGFNDFTTQDMPKEKVIPEMSVIPVMNENRKHNLIRTEEEDNSTLTELNSLGFDFSDLSLFDQIVTDPTEMTEKSTSNQNRNETFLQNSSTSQLGMSTVGTEDTNLSLVTSNYNSSAVSENANVVTDTVSVTDFPTAINTKASYQPTFTDQESITTSTVQHMRFPEQPILGHLIEDLFNKTAVETQKESEKNVIHNVSEKEDLATSSNNVVPIQFTLTTIRDVSIENITVLDNSEDKTETNNNKLRLIELKSSENDTNMLENTALTFPPFDNLTFPEVKFINNTWTTDYMANVTTTTGTSSISLDTKVEILDSVVNTDRISIPYDTSNISVHNITNDSVERIPDLNDVFTVNETNHSTVLGSILILNNISNISASNESNDTKKRLPNDKSNISLTSKRYENKETIDNLSTINGSYDTPEILSIFSDNSYLSTKNESNDTTEKNTILHDISKISMNYETNDTLGKINDSISTTTESYYRISTVNVMSDRSTKNETYETMARMSVFNDISTINSTEMPIVDDMSAIFTVKETFNTTERILILKDESSANQTYNTKERIPLLSDPTSINESYYATERVLNVDDINNISAINKTDDLTERMTTIISGNSIRNETYPTVRIPIFNEDSEVNKTYNATERMSVINKTSKIPKNNEIGYTAYEQPIINNIYTRNETYTEGIPTTQDILNVSKTNEIYNTTDIMSLPNVATTIAITNETYNTNDMMNQKDINKLNETETEKIVIFYDKSDLSLFDQIVTDPTEMTEKSTSNQNRNKTVNDTTDTTKKITITKDRTDISTIYEMSNTTDRKPSIYDIPTLNETIDTTENISSVHGMSSVSVSNEILDTNGKVTIADDTIQISATNETYDAITRNAILNNVSLINNTYVTTEMSILHENSNVSAAYETNDVTDRILNNIPEINGTSILNNISNRSATDETYDPTEKILNGSSTINKAYDTTTRMLILDDISNISTNTETYTIKGKTSTLKDLSNITETEETHTNTEQISILNDIANVSRTNDTHMYTDNIPVLNFISTERTLILNESFHFSSINETYGTTESIPTHHDISNLSVTNEISIFNNRSTISERDDISKSISILDRVPLVNDISTIKKTNDTTERMPIFDDISDMSATYKTNGTTDRMLNHTPITNEIYNTTQTISILSDTFTIFASNETKNTTYRMPTRNYPTNASITNDVYNTTERIQILNDLSAFNDTNSTKTISAFRKTSHLPTLNETNDTADRNLSLHVITNIVATNDTYNNTAIILNISAMNKTYDPTEDIAIINHISNISMINETYNIAEKNVNHGDVNNISTVNETLATIGGTYNTTETYNTAESILISSNKLEIPVSRDSYNSTKNISILNNISTATKTYNITEEMPVKNDTSNIHMTNTTYDTSMTILNDTSTINGTDNYTDIMSTNNISTFNESNNINEITDKISILNEMFNISTTNVANDINEMIAVLNNMSNVVISNDTDKTFNETEVRKDNISLHGIPKILPIKAFENSVRMSVVAESDVSLINESLATTEKSPLPFEVRNILIIENSYNITDNMQNKTGSNVTTDNEEPVNIDNTEMKTTEKDHYLQNLPFQNNTGAVKEPTNGTHDTIDSVSFLNNTRSNVAVLNETYAIDDSIYDLIDKISKQSSNGSDIESPMVNNTVSDITATTDVYISKGNISILNNTRSNTALTADAYRQTDNTLVLNNIRSINVSEINKATYNITVPVNNGSNILGTSDNYGTTNNMTIPNNTRSNIPTKSEIHYTTDNVTLPNNARSYSAIANAIFNSTDKISVVKNSESSTQATSEMYETTGDITTSNNIRSGYVISTSSEIHHTTGDSEIHHTTGDISISNDTGYNTVTVPVVNHTTEDIRILNTGPNISITSKVYDITDITSVPINTANSDVTTMPYNITDTLSVPNITRPNIVVTEVNDTQGLGQNTTRPDGIVNGSHDTTENIRTRNNTESNIRAENEIYNTTDNRSNNTGFNIAIANDIYDTTVNLPIFNNTGYSITTVNVSYEQQTGVTTENMLYDTTDNTSIPNANGSTIVNTTGINDTLNIISSLNVTGFDIVSNDTTDNITTSNNAESNFKMANIIYPAISIPNNTRTTIDATNSSYDTTDKISTIKIDVATANVSYNTTYNISVPTVSGSYIVNATEKYNTTKRISILKYTRSEDKMANVSYGTTDNISTQINNRFNVKNAKEIYNGTDDKSVIHITRSLGTSSNISIDPTDRTLIPNNTGSNIATVKEIFEATSDLSILNNTGSSIATANAPNNTTDKVLTLKTVLTVNVSYDTNVSTAIPTVSGSNIVTAIEINDTTDKISTLNSTGSYDAMVNIFNTTPDNISNNNGFNSQSANDTYNSADDKTLLNIAGSDVAAINISSDRVGSNSIPNDTATAKEIFETTGELSILNNTGSSITTSNASHYTIDKVLTRITDVVTVNASEFTTNNTSIQNSGSSLVNTIDVYDTTNRISTLDSPGFAIVNESYDTTGNISISSSTRSNSTTKNEIYDTRDKISILNSIGFTVAMMNLSNNATNNATLHNESIITSGNETYSTKVNMVISNNPGPDIVTENEANITTERTNVSSNFPFVEEYDIVNNVIVSNKTDIVNNVTISNKTVSSMSATNITIPFSSANTEEDLTVLTNTTNFTPSTGHIGDKVTNISITEYSMSNIKNNSASVSFTSHINESSLSNNDSQDKLITTINFTSSASNATESLANIATDLIPNTKILNDSLHVSNNYLTATVTTNDNDMEVNHTTNINSNNIVSILNKTSAQKVKTIWTTYEKSTNIQNITNIPKPFKNMTEVVGTLVIPTNIAVLSDDITTSKKNSDTIVGTVISNTTEVNPMETVNPSVSSTAENKSPEATERYQIPEGKTSTATYEKTFPTENSPTDKSSLTKLWEDETKRTTQAMQQLLSTSEPTSNMGGFTSGTNSFYLFDVNLLGDLLPFNIKRK